MPLRTSVRSTSFIIGTTLTAPATLTSLYTDNQVSFPTEMYDGMKLYVNYTPAEPAAKCTIQVEYSPDGITYFPESTEEQEVSGEVTLLTWRANLDGVTPGVSYKRAYRVPVDSSFVRLSAKEAASSDFGTVGIQGEFKINRT